MSDQVQVAKNSLDVLSEASQNMGSKLSAVTTILGIANQLTSAFPFVGIVLGVVERFLPGSEHDEILRGFKKLSNQIEEVKDDIKELEGMIKWEITQLQYGDVVNRIKLGMHFCVEIANGVGDEKLRYQERLKEVCANQNFSLAVSTLLDGMAGSGLFQKKSILDDFYNQTKGDRGKMASLATRLLQQVSGGVIVIATYETLMRGKEGAEELTKRYDSQLKEVYAKVQSVIDRCVEKFKENMLGDLDEFLDADQAGHKLLPDMKKFMSDKYDWLETFCVVYKDMNGLIKQYLKGDRVDILNRNGKCGIVFYRTKDEPLKSSERYIEATKIVNDVWCVNTKEGCNNIVSKIEKSGIGWTGCAVIKRGSNIWCDGNFSSKTVQVAGANATAILLLN